MQGKHLYEYAVIRLVPKVEREEFFNVGIILFSKRAKYIKALYKVPERFRWLTAVRSASIQTSRPHPGFSDDLDQTLEILFRELVL